MKKWIVTVVETSDTCDGKARILGAFDSKDAGLKFIKDDMDKWVANCGDDDVEVDYDKMSAYFGFNTSDGCEWNIEEIDIG